MKVRILAVGGVKGHLASVVEEYENRASHYWRLEVDEVAGGAGKSRKPDAEAIKKAEEARLLARVGPGDTVVALTRDGKSLGSRQLARYLEEGAIHSRPAVTFVIGGAFGLGKELLKRATLRLSLSAMTLPHEVARMVLAEQLYRAGSILRNEPYHKGP